MNRRIAKGILARSERAFVGVGWRPACPWHKSDRHHGYEPPAHLVDRAIIRLEWRNAYADTMAPFTPGTRAFRMRAT